MEVIFYDRKNKQEVKASQLMSINLIEVSLTIDSEEYNDGKWLGAEKHPAYLRENKIGTIGYKSKDCDKHRNWDMWLLESDLVFLRVDEV